MVERRSKSNSDRSSRSSQSSSASWRSQIKAPTQGLDFLEVEGDIVYQQQFIKPEAEIVVMFSSKVRKYDKYSMRQDRSIVITNLNLYNFKRKELRRYVPIVQLSGLTKALNDKSLEFVIHVNDECDFRLESKEREQLIMVLKMAYLSQVKENLPIYGIPKVKNLSDFCTSQSDAARGISRMPMILARLYEEDIKIEKNNKSPLNKYRFSPSNNKAVNNQALTGTMPFGEAQAEAIIENLQVNLEHRNTASRNNYQRQRSNEADMHLNRKNGEARFRSLDSDFRYEESFTKNYSSTIYRKNNVVESTFDDFELLRIIGRGSYGKVYLVKQHNDNQLFAMKVVRKDTVLQSDNLESLALEKLILAQVNHPFIIGLNYVFQKSYRIYFICDFVQGGELFKHLTEEKRFSEFKTKFYAAQIALALGYLHDSNIIYRDLKPENILIDRHGYIKLADFGLVKITDPHGLEDPNSFCGTPEYLSPEMIEGTGHDHTLDWWALGILIYEMIIGIPPFYNQNKHQMYNLITNAPIRWPNKERHGIEVSPEAQDLITQMLNKNRKDRLGQMQDVDEILSHPWFRELDMNQLLERQIKAPFIPHIENRSDVQNFDPQVTGEELKESIVPEESKKIIKNQQNAFLTFGPMGRTTSAGQRTQTSSSGSSQNCSKEVMQQQQLMQMTKPPQLEGSVKNI